MRPREEGTEEPRPGAAWEEKRTTEVATKAACASKGQGPPFSKLQASPASKT